MEQAVREAIAAYQAWMEADGIFPDPEYDDFRKSMGRLAATLTPDPTVIKREIRAGKKSRR